jgi:uncharacterized protein YbjT (DUF2867 family)
MFVIAGATGNTGSVVASALLAQGKPVTALVRDPRKAEGLRGMGAQLAAISLLDAGALTQALAGAEGAYLLIPPNAGADDFIQYGFRTGETLAAAVKSSGIPHVVFLSSIGAQHEQGTGPIRPLHHAESAIGAVAKNLTILRPAYFLENWGIGIEAVRNQGVLHNFLTPDRKVPMISTADIGRIAADCLTDPARGRRIKELSGPEDYSPRDIAQVFSTALGKPVNIETHSLDAIAPILTSMGISQDFALLYREMVQGINSGHVAYEGAAPTERGQVTALESISQLLGLPARQSGGKGA